MGLFEKFSRKSGDPDYVAKLIAENPAPSYELSEDESVFWGTFVNEFILSDEWVQSMTRLIEYWRQIDVNNYPMYEPLQELTDWELAYATEVWIVYEFIDTFVKYGEIEELDPVVGGETRAFVAEYLCALARKMDETDIKGFISVLKSQIAQFGIEDLKSEGSGLRFK